MRTWFITGASRGFGELIVKQALEAGDHAWNMHAQGSNAWIWETNFS